YVLFPWFNEQAYQHHHFYKSIDRVNIGGLPFLPNATVLVERFVQRLIDMGPEQIQKEGILPRGTIEEWQSSLSETVLVGLVDSPEAYRRFMRKKRYTRPLSKLKKGWQKACYIALYVKQGITTKNGVFVYGKIKNVSVKKRPIMVTDDVWENLPRVRKPVQYGSSNYILTTLDALKESAGLPELCMKSKEEVILWRMLRRRSDRIKLELDDQRVDHATSLKEYRIKNIKIVIQRDSEEIILDNEQIKNVISVDKLERNPSAVFRKLVNML